MRLMLYHLTMAIKNWRTVRFTDVGRQTQPAVDAVVWVKEKPEQQPARRWVAVLASQAGGS